MGTAGSFLQGTVMSVSSNLPHRQQQAGVALISVLLVFALVAMIASQVVSRSYLDLKRTANTVNGKQAHFYALAGEEFARQLLARDSQEALREGSDSYADNWHQLKDRFALEHGDLELEIIDLQGRFNVNNLLNENGLADARHRQAFNRLLHHVEAPGQLSDQLVDWLDEDHRISEGGAEKQQYLKQTAAYLPANQLLSDVSELRLLLDMDSEIFAEIQPLLSTLPVITAFNINTMDSKLLQALLPDLTSSQIEQFQQQQSQGGYTEVIDWYQHPVGRYLPDLGLKFSVSSSYFEVRSRAIFAGRVSRIKSLLHREPESGEITVLMRQQIF
jgi:general secretion pathway protein K